MTRVVVATAVIGQHTDRLRPPRVVAQELTYVCFSDQPVACAPWVVRRVRVSAGQMPVWTAREIKLRLHRHLPTAEVTIWQDAAYQLSVHPRVFVPPLAHADVWMLPHPDRSTVVAEAAELGRLGIVPDDRSGRQAEAYVAHGLPADPPLASTGLLVRRHTPAVLAFNERWWSELVAWGHPRDQMSVNYAAWREGIRIGWLDGHYRDNPYARWHSARVAA